MRVAFWVLIMGVPMAWASPRIPLEPVELDDDGTAPAIPGIAFITIPQESTNSTIEPVSPDHEGTAHVISGIPFITIPQESTHSPIDPMAPDLDDGYGENSNQLLLKGNSPDIRGWAKCYTYSFWTWGCPSHDPICCGGQYCCDELFPKCCEGDKCCNICDGGGGYCPSTHYCCPGTTYCCIKGTRCCGKNQCCPFWGK